MLGALILCALQGIGCDQCGCGLLQGVQPFDRANNFGLQWRMRYLNGDVTSPGTTLVAKHGGHVATANPTASYTEVYQALELRGQFWLGQRINLTASVPLVNNYQAVDGIRQADTYALGDPMLLGRYVLSGSSNGHDSIRIRHRFTAGVGVKIPIGRHDVVQYGETLDHDLQPGSGTWDGLASLEYVLRGQRVGASFSAVGRLNGQNAEGHRMGHSTSITGEVFRIFHVQRLQVLPALGGYLEAARPDRTSDAVDEGTGGSTFFTHASTRVWWRSIGFSFTWQHAILNNEGSLMIPNRERFVAGITYNFQRV